RFSVVTESRIVNFVAEAVKVAGSLQINFAVESGGRSETAAIQGDVTQNLGLVARFDDVEGAGRAGLAGLALGCGIIQHRHVQLAIRVEWARVALFDAESEPPGNLTGVRVHRA